MIFFDDDFDCEEAFYLGCIGGLIEQSNEEEEERRIRTIREEDDIDDREDLDTYY